MIEKRKLRERLAELIRQRDNFVAQANQTIAAYNGRIAMLEELLGESQDDEGSEQDDPPRHHVSGAGG